MGFRWLDGTITKEAPEELRAVGGEGDTIHLVRTGESTWLERSQDMPTNLYTERERKEYEDWEVLHFPKTEDSRKVKKWWGDYFNQGANRLLWKGREQEILAYAQEQEKKEQEDKEKRR